MATQVQIRGTSQTTQEARTLVSRELDINTTDNRLCVHNGSTAGGVRHVNMFDQQNSEFNYATTSGTNAITASMRIAPLSYTTGQIFWLKIANTNTASCSLNIDSLGAKTIKKVFNGALSNLGAGDLISGQMVGVLYDGTQFQIVSGSGSEFGRQDWVPQSYSGYTTIESISEAYYVDLGNAVIVACDVFATRQGDATKTRISNLPFISSVGTGTITALPQFKTLRMPEGENFLEIDAQLHAFDNQNVQFTITYIKAS